MVRGDIERWNEKYRKRSRSSSIEPDPLLLQHRELLEPGGLCIDIAGGIGDNGLYLSQIGYRSIVVDGSEAGLRLCRHKALDNGLATMLVVADLDRFVLPESAFDAVLVFRYLNRKLISAIQRGLRDGGVLFFKTFNARHLLTHPQFPEEFVLAEGELTSWFSGLHCVDTNDGRSPDTTWHWVGYKPMTD